MDLTVLFVGLFTLVLGLAAGAGAYALWLKRETRLRLRMPNKWPLRSRTLTSREEWEVWKWLRTTFPEHHVMIKIPVLRFTTLRDQGESPEDKRGQRESLLTLLSGVYATFAVSTADGKVVGCVDVPSKRGFSKDARNVKESLLSDCGVAYTVVRPTHLPSAGAMRAAFLGEIPVVVQPEQDTLGGDSSFLADLDNFSVEKVKAAKEAAQKEINRQSNEVARQSKAHAVANGFTPERSGAFLVDGTMPEWEDSFSSANDSRPGQLY